MIHYVQEELLVSRHLIFENGVPKLFHEYILGHDHLVSHVFATLLLLDPLAKGNDARKAVRLTNTVKEVHVGVARVGEL